MRFPLLRRLSLLIHRRARSEDFTGFSPVAPLDALTRSYSLSNLGEQAGTASTWETVVPQITIPPPHALHTPSDSPVIAYPPVDSERRPYKLAAVSQRILELEHELGQLKADNAHLKDDNSALKFDLELLQEQLGFLENAERPLSSDVRLITKEALEILKRQARRCSEMDRFVRTIIDLGLKTEKPIFPRVHNAIMTGATHDEAVVEAIREAAAKPDSPWATIIPAVIGPRTNEQYLSALNMTIQCRRENKDLQNVKKFWKNVAKEDPANGNLVTPSSSNLSSIQVILPEKRQRAVDDLLAKLRNGTIPMRSQVITQSSMVAPSIPTSNKITEPSNTYHDLSASSGSEHDTRPTISPSEIGVTINACASDISATLAYLRDSSVPSLPPLASQRFKEELIASHSSERFSISTTYKYKHVLGSRDLNEAPSDSHADQQPVRLSFELSVLASRSYSDRTSLHTTRLPA